MRICSAKIIVVAALSTAAGVVFAAPLVNESFENGMPSSVPGVLSWCPERGNVYVGSDPIDGSRVIPYQGQLSLAMVHRGKEDGQDSSNECRFNTFASTDEVWVSFNFRVPDNFYHRSQDSSANNKWFVLWTDEYESQGLTVAFEYWPDGSGGSRLAYRWVRNGDRVPGHQGHSQFIRVPEDRGKWMHFVMHVKRASSSTSSDGVIQTWIRREGASTYTKLHDVNNAPLSVSGMSQTFNSGYLMGWANSGFDQDTKFYVDNFVLSRESLLGAQTAPDESPPKPPTGVSATN